jgi:hypothetical protein
VQCKHGEMNFLVIVPAQLSKVSWARGSKAGGGRVGACCKGTRTAMTAWHYTPVQKAVPTRVRVELVRLILTPWVLPDHALGLTLTVLLLICGV